MNDQKQQFVDASMHPFYSYFYFIFYLFVCLFPTNWLWIPTRLVALYHTTGPFELHFSKFYGMHVNNIYSSKYEIRVRTLKVIRILIEFQMITDPRGHIARAERTTTKICGYSLNFNLHLNANDRISVSTNQIDDALWLNK